MKNQTQIIYNLVVIIFALIGVIVVLVLYVVGVLDFLTQDQQEQVPAPSQTPLQTPEPATPASTLEVDTPTTPPESQMQTTQESVQEPAQEPTGVPSKPTPPPATQQQIQPAQPFNDKDCGDFQTHAQAQAFFESQGGPAQDPHKLDRNKDGVVCESLL